MWVQEFSHIRTNEALTSSRIMFRRWILLILLLRAISPNFASREPPNALRTIMKVGQFAEKVNAKLQTLVPLLKQQVQSRSGGGGGYADWLGYADGGHDMMASKSEYSWLIPVVTVIGLGTLVIPLLGTYMTSMLTQGTINLTAGRRRRSADKRDEQRPWKLDDLLHNVDSAIDKFTSQLNL